MNGYLLRCACDELWGFTAVDERSARAEAARQHPCQAFTLLHVAPYGPMSAPAPEPGEVKK